MSSSLRSWKGKLKLRIYIFSYLSMFDMHFYVFLVEYGFRTWFMFVCMQVRHSHCWCRCEIYTSRLLLVVDFTPFLTLQEESLPYILMPQLICLLIPIKIWTRQIHISFLAGLSHLKSSNIFFNLIIFSKLIFCNLIRLWWLLRKKSKLLK